MDTINSVSAEWRIFLVRSEADLNGESDGYHVVAHSIREAERVFNTNQPNEPAASVELVSRWVLLSQEAKSG